MPTYTQTQSGTTAVPLLGGDVQAKLAVGQENDQYEREADTVAAQVTSGTAGEPLAISAARPEAFGQAETDAVMPVQQKHIESTSASADAGPVSGNTGGATNSINVPHSAGQPLPTSTRVLMETQFGRDFSQVRTHTDKHDAEAAESINAQAFTVGQDVVFGAGQYAPETSRGQQLLAHELTHVVQQSANQAAGDVSSAETASPTVVQRQPTGRHPPGLRATDLLAPAPMGSVVLAEQTVRRWLRRNRLRFMYSSEAQVIAAVRSELHNASAPLSDENIKAIAREVGITFLPAAATPAPARPPLSESGPQADTPAPDAGAEPNMATTVVRAVASYRDVNQALQNAAPNAARQPLREMEQRGTGESLTRRPPEEERRRDE